MSSRCRSGIAPGGHALRDCLGLLESLVRYGERHIAQDACWLAVTFTNLRAALALAMSASLWPGIGFRNPPMYEKEGSLESTNGNDTMNAQTNERRTDSRTSPTPQGNNRNRPRTYEQPALGDVPLNPKRSGYVVGPANPPRPA